MDTNQPITSSPSSSGDNNPHPDPNDPLNQSPPDDVTFAFSHLHINNNNDSNPQQLLPEPSETDDTDEEEEEDDEEEDYEEDDGDQDFTFDKYFFLTIKMYAILKHFEHLKLHLEAIKSATNNFADENCIGIGGFGKVYKGELLHYKGQSIVAVKRLDRTCGQGNNEFWKEILMLSQYKHKNVVSLLGYCDKGDEKILVYEYASNGSLEKYLNNDNLTWKQRLNICIGAARGLAYLHNPGESQQRVLHRDIKSSNILLDENWNARISDFGLSKLGPANQRYTFLVSHPVGTIGYWDPMYIETGFLTKESDVYSFGVVLFEVLCGRLSVYSKNDTRRPFASLVREYYKKNKINELIYSNILDEINPKSLVAFTTIAHQCLNTRCKKRPLMTEVVSMLENALEYQDNAESSKVMDGEENTIIIDSSHLRALRLPDRKASNKVMQLIYTNSGSALVVLASSGLVKVWQWPTKECNPSQKSTASIVPRLLHPLNGALMANHLNVSVHAEESIACIALSNNDSYVLSASGGKVSLFDMMSFKALKTFMSPPPAATCLAFHPQDNNTIAIGMEDSTIEIYSIRFDRRLFTLKGHRRQITGLAFSQALSSMVSSGADAKLCMWNIKGWEKLKSRRLQLPDGYPSSLAGDTKVQYHNDQHRLLVVHESQIAIYDPKLKCLKLWSPRESLSAPVSSAIYSCDCLLIFTGLLDGGICVFDSENLKLRYRIPCYAYIPPSISISGSSSSSNNTSYPMVIAAHPSDPNQFALGMKDGSVHVIEPVDADSNWGLSKIDLASAEKSKAVDVAYKNERWKLSKIVDSSHLKALRLPGSLADSKVMQLIYTNSGLGLLALASNAIHNQWKWQQKSTASVVPLLRHPKNWAVMSNHLNESKPAEVSRSCIALSKNDSYVISASGGKVSLFNMMTSKVIATFLTPPPAATSLIFQPQDNNIAAIGMEDSTIQIYDIRRGKALVTLKGHQKQITGLAFSMALNSLVASGADAQLCIWNINGWGKLKSRSLQSPPGYPSPLIGDTKVQYHNDQRHLLVVHESHFAIYDPNLECLKLWSPRESLSISSAIYSCDSLLIFTGFSDGAVGVFDAESLSHRCNISPSAYMTPSISSDRSAYPLVVAAHPSDRNQFALGMSDGSVYVIEPADVDSRWGGSTPQENGTLASSKRSYSEFNSQPSDHPDNGT